MFLDRREQFFTRMKNKYLTKCLCMTILLSQWLWTSPLSVMAAEEDVVGEAAREMIWGMAVRLPIPGNRSHRAPDPGTDTPTPDPGTDTPTPDPGTDTPTPDP